MTYFGYFGMAVAGLLALAVLAAVVIGLIILWQEYGPKFHCRKPETRLVLSTYRADVISANGKDIKCAPDLELRRIIGISWKLKLIVGLITLGKANDRA